MPRKKNTRGAWGSGTIRQRKDGTWEARVTVGKDPGTGKQKQKSVYAKTQAEVQKKLKALQAEVDGNSYTEAPKKMTVKTWMKTWLDEYCGDIKTSTKVLYQGYSDNHIVPGLGAVGLADLSPDLVQKFINKLSRATKTKKPLSPKTIKNIHGCLSAAMAQAVTLNYIKDNPASKCKLPKNDDEKAVETIKPFDSGEITAFTEAIKGSAYESIYLVALNTGMRLSEILGLQWNRINIDTGEIVIDRQLAILRKKGDVRRITPTKSRNKRTIIAPKAVLTILKAVQKQQAQWKLAAGEVWSNEDGLVFTNEIGGSVPHASIEHQFRRIANACGLSAHVFHDLRHTFAVEMIRAGVDIETVSKWLGHFDPGFTLRVYADMTPDMRQSAADKLQTIIENRRQA